MQILKNRRVLGFVKMTCARMYRPRFSENKPKTGSINSGTEKFVFLLRESANG
jgi:hypothetical protein